MTSYFSQNELNMTKLRRLSRQNTVHTNLSNISYDTTYVGILPRGLHLSAACAICEPKLDIHKKKISTKKQKKRHKHI